MVASAVVSDQIQPFVKGVPSGTPRVEITLLGPAGFVRVFDRGLLHLRVRLGDGGGQRGAAGLLHGDHRGRRDRDAEDAAHQIGDRGFAQMILARQQRHECLGLGAEGERGQAGGERSPHDAAALGACAMVQADFGNYGGHRGQFKILLPRGRAGDRFVRREVMATGTHLGQHVLRRAAQLGLVHQRTRGPRMARLPAAFTSRGLLASGPLMLRAILGGGEGRVA